MNRQQLISWLDHRIMHTENYDKSDKFEMDLSVAKDLLKELKELN